MKNINIAIAGLGNVGSALITSILDNKDYIINKSNINLNIIGISAKNFNKKRNFDINNFKWFEEPIELIKEDNLDVFIELIGTEKGISYDLVSNALKNKLHVITANKALLANCGNELFDLAEKNNVSLLYEASVAGGLPIIKIIKDSLFLNKINKISGILNGTTNFILSEMYKKNSDFDIELKNAQSNGYAETDPTNDIEGLDAAHKLTILSVLCFGVNFNLKNVFYKGISDINKSDIIFSKKLGYKIKLVSTSEIIDNKIISIVEPTLVKESSKLSNVNDVKNGLKIETNHHESLFFEGEGAGGMATASSIISDLLEISKLKNNDSLGYKINNLIPIKSIDYNERRCSFYLRIVVKDLPGVLAKITSYLNNEKISIETILQLPENTRNNLNNQVPIIITTHETSYGLINQAIEKIKKLDFVISNIKIISIDKNII
tara:strand:- start:2197 stop:3504 length:1308 start_codon:yes stop_codon:yes gene_type:complete